MASYERQARVRAPLETVWAFHSTTDGLRALTPSWVSLRIEDIVQPGSDTDTSRTLIEGTEIYASVAPFWIFPRQHWVSVIESRSETGLACEFVDTMHDGPLPAWTHTHRFVGNGEETRIVDHVEFDAPGGSLGTHLVKAALDVVFRYRHWRTRKILE